MIVNVRNVAGVLNTFKLHVLVSIDNWLYSGKNQPSCYMLYYIVSILALSNHKSLEII